MTKVSTPASILERVAQGDQSAVKECVSTYGALIWSIARRLTRSQTDAEDAVQEVFIDIWKSASRFDASKASEKTFVAMIARRRLIDRLRKSKTETDTTSLADAPDPVGAQGESVERKADASLAARAMRELKPEQRRLLQLSIFHGLTHSEIAEMTSTPLGTVKSHIRRGLLTVREKLTTGGAAPDEGMPS
jgi:RNA polymerase sigma-70 factor (ECF subfamily)